MKINNPLQNSSRLKLEKEIELYKSNILRDSTLHYRIKEHNSKYKDDVEVVGVSMFENCTQFNGNITNWNPVGIDFSQMFKSYENK